MNGTDHHLLLQGFAQAMAQSHGAIDSIWLFGSRVNGTARADSDWDVLVFSAQDLSHVLARQPPPRGLVVDLLFVNRSTRQFCKPWLPTSAVGDFDDWRWVEVSATVAHYRATKFEAQPVLLAGKLRLAGPSTVHTYNASRLWPPSRS